MLRAPETSQLQSPGVVLTDTEPLSPSSDPPRPVERAPPSRSHGSRRWSSPSPWSRELVLRFWTPLAPVARRSAQRRHRPVAASATSASALRQDGHPPLYYYLLHEWMLVFGAGRHRGRALVRRARSAHLSARLARRPPRRRSSRRMGVRRAAVAVAVRHPVRDRDAHVLARDRAGPRRLSADPQRARATDDGALDRPRGGDRRAVAQPLLGDVADRGGGSRARLAGMAFSRRARPDRADAGRRAGGRRLLPAVVAVDALSVGTHGHAMGGRRAPNDDGDADRAGLRRRLQRRRAVARLGDWSRCSCSACSRPGSTITASCSTCGPCRKCVERPPSSA